MSSGDERSLVEAFLLVDAPRQRLSHWTAALAALDSPGAPQLATVTARYDSAADQAVLSLYYRTTPRDPAALSFVDDVAALAEAKLIQLAGLSSRERLRFRTERLANCSLAVEHANNVVGALQELVRQLRRAPSQPPEFGPFHPAPVVNAKGTRDELAAIRAPNGDRTSGATQRAGSSGDSAAPTGPGEFLDSAQIIVDDEIRYKVPPPLPRATRRSDNDARTNAASIPPAPTKTVDAPRSDPRTSQRDSKAEAPPFAHTHRAGNGSIFPLTAAAAPNQIFARYLRSGKWLPLRIGSLSLRGAVLLASALPRVDDVVDIALSYGDHRALVRGKVGTVSSHRDAVLTGASRFSVSFDHDEASHRQLTLLLTAARSANVTIKPPPARETRRFTVEWSVCLGTKRGVIKADACDVSLSGMFVRPSVALEVDSTCSFSIVVDDGGEAVAGRARVVRQLEESAAATCGQAAGFGLAISEISEADRPRWEAFIARIEKRTAKRILIGAPSPRLAKLQAALAGAGYAVLGGADPGSLAQLATAGARPVDAALIDASWLHRAATGSMVEDLFKSRNVPYVAAHADMRGARTAIDKLLEIIDETGK
jgi:hypothetical protein